MGSDTSGLRHSRRVVAVIGASVTAALILAVFAVTAMSSPEGPAEPVVIDIALTEFAAGLDKPVDVVSSGLRLDRRLFVVEKDGLVRVVDHMGQVQVQPYLDITSRVVSAGERGFLGLAFDPDFADNSYFYVNYTRVTDSATVISRFAAHTPWSAAADPSSESILLVVPQPYFNHNAGDLEFGPDGYLYVPLGDGGSGGDPQNRAQNPGELLGKILRLDVNPSAGLAADCGGTGAEYSVPADNPLVDGPGGDCDEIWSMGLRNPWRIAFDSESGDLFLADVGQNTREEVNFQSAATGGENYGWRCYEGSLPFNTSDCGPSGQYRDPIFEYAHNTPEDHCSVTGGRIYRGTQYPQLRGHYLLADYCSGYFWSLVELPGDTWQATEHGNRAPFPTGFGERIDGEIFVVSFSVGRLYHISETTPGPLLAVSKRGPSTASSSQPMTYTLTVTNSGTVAASGAILTDTLPAQANYVGSSDGGFEVGQAAVWNLGALAPGEVRSVTLIVSSSVSLINDEYMVTAAGGYGAIGYDSVLTLVDPSFLYLPTVQRP